MIHSNYTLNLSTNYKILIRDHLILLQLLISLPISPLRNCWQYGMSSCLTEVRHRYVYCANLIKVDSENIKMSLVREFLGVHSKCDRPSGAALLIAASVAGQEQDRNAVHFGRGNGVSRCPANIVQRHANNTLFAAQNSVGSSKVHQVCVNLYKKIVPQNS